MEFTKNDTSLVGAPGNQIWSNWNADWTSRDGCVYAKLQSSLKFNDFSYLVHPRSSPLNNDVWKTIRLLFGVRYMCKGELLNFQAVSSFHLPKFWSQDLVPGSFANSSTCTAMTTELVMILIQFDSIFRTQGRITRPESLKAMQNDGKIHPKFQHPSPWLPTQIRGETSISTNPTENMAQGRRMLQTSKQLNDNVDTENLQANSGCPKKPPAISTPLATRKLNHVLVLSDLSPK